MKRKLLLGCGVDKRLRMAMGDIEDPSQYLLTTLDYNSDRNPDIVWDLKNLPIIDLGDDTFDEVHCYHVIEHLWAQGDYKSFFAFFTEVWRLLKPNGIAFFTYPNHKHGWALGDPSHTSIIHHYQFMFLSQDFYKKEVDENNGMGSDFRFLWKKDFQTLKTVYDDTGENFEVITVLRKVAV